MASSPLKKQIDRANRRDTLIAISVGVALVAFLAMALIYSFEHAGGRGVHGILVQKIFVVHPQTEISVGAGGLNKKEIPGEFSFKVRDTIKGTVYTLSVSKEVYDRYSEGDEYFFSATN
ncbi:unnamed protein product [uncultured bacterium]|nr:unnamed protein product [uncultured bacterium]